MSPGRPLRLGIVGCGRIAERGYAPAIAGLDAVELAAVADPFAERARLVARAAAARPSISPGAAELIAGSGLDAVVVASPAERHLADAELAAAAGLPCLVEKPPAPDGPGAEALARLHPAPWVGFNRRFQHASEILDLIPSDVGIEIEIDLRYRRAAWSPHGELGDALQDLGPHAVDLALVISGSPHASVDAAAIGDRSAELELVTARGRALLRCSTDRPHLERVEVRRPEGELLASTGSGGLGANLAARLRRREHPLVGSLRRQLAAFAAAIAGSGDGLLATAREGERVMAVIDEARARA